MSAGHAFLPPSGAGAWRACALWPTMNRLYPDDDSTASLEGTAAHWVWAEDLQRRHPAPGTLAPNGVAVTAEMWDGADIYLDTIQADLVACGLDERYLVVERRVAIPQVHPENWGTPDTWFYDERQRRLYVYDYKFGRDPVEAFENWQCIDYTAGILDELAAAMRVEVALLDQHVEIVITVVQPRNYHGPGPVQRWAVRASDLRAHINILRSAAERATAPNPPATPGPQCDYCPGRAACRALQKQGYRAAHLSEQSVPIDLPPEALGVELAMLEDAQRLLKARVEGLQEQAFARIKRGERVNGYGIEESFGREDWKVPAEQVIATARLFGVEVSNPGAITPKQAIEKGAPVAMVQALAGRATKGLKLVRDTGKRATQVFGKS